MIYIFLDENPTEKIILKGDTHRYLIKVRRHSVGDEILFRNRDTIKILYRYKIIEIHPRSLELQLISSSLLEVQSEKNLHIAWCIIDSKSIEKVLPSLCEIGVKRISFLGCDRSQKNFKLDFKRFRRIIESSMQQCGRSSYIEFDRFTNIQEFIGAFPNTKVFDFCDTILDSSLDFKEVLIGCEGGFSSLEKEFLTQQEVFKLDTPMVLRSESAVMAVASKILL